ncbi:MAG: hypothetical protein R2704_10425 [Microthrixaceae bacterium]|nr:hypothetical protein [Microthrixaceae bacterium]
MLDHVFTDAIGALRDAMERAMLERQAFEERFQTDILLGDITWETSYGLPGEGTPPRIRADLTLEWPTWSQTAYRSWYIDEDLTEAPSIEIEVSFRIQRLSEEPDLRKLLDALPPDSPKVGTEVLHREGLTTEALHDAELTDTEWSAEISYEGLYELDESTLADGSVLDDHFGAMGGWVAATLVRLGDLTFQFLPSSESDA